MSVPVIKALCRRIEQRLGNGRLAAAAAGVSAGVWSGYCSDDHADITIPLHRLMTIASAQERAAFADLLRGGEGRQLSDLLTEAAETVEEAAELQALVREAIRDGALSPNEKKRIRAKALGVKAQAEDVIRVVDE